MSWVFCFVLFTSVHCLAVLPPGCKVVQSKRRWNLNPVYLPAGSDIVVGNDALATSVYSPAVSGGFIPSVQCPNQSNPPKNTTLIVTGEWYGVSQATFDLVGNLTANGYNCVIPNVYRDRNLPVDSTWINVDDVNAAQNASSYKMQNMNWTQSVEDIQSIASSFERVSLVGFSFGAVLSSLSAQNIPNLAAVALFYGTPGAFTGSAPSLFNPQKVTVPVQLHCGEEDPFQGFSTCNDMQTLANKLINSSLFKYKGFHGFMNSQSWFENWKAAQTPPKEPFDKLTFMKALDHLVRFLDSN